MKTSLITGWLMVSAVSVLAAARITVGVDRPGHPVSPMLWGIFFEDINLSADGGLWPELVRNRSFEDAAHPENWRILDVPGGSSEAAIDEQRPLNPLNRRSLRLRINGGVSVQNRGYYGMNFVQGERYLFSVAARSDDFDGQITVRALGKAGPLASGTIRGMGRGWNEHTLTLVPEASEPQGSLDLTFAGSGTVFLDMVSLKPETSWKGHGLRNDLAEAMAALKPSFLRFPGGCWVEGEDLARMYHWKRTVGAREVRVPLQNIWGYQATHAIGYHEYLQMAEDLGAEPLFCVNAGMSHRENVPLDQMAQWVQDALDAIEYANGPIDSVWGGLRARNGHPAPFGLKYLEIGNENGGPAYAERWPLFVKAIRSRYPEIRLIANHWLGDYPRSPRPDVVDEHFYDTPEWFMEHATRYDTYDRRGPKIFVGEYAVTRNTGRGNLRGALGEAAFMTGLERNSDVVTMAAYAPLFCNANHQRWPVNLINFDSSRWYGIPSYYVQKLFAEHRGSVTLPTAVEAERIEEPAPKGGIGVGTWNTSAEFKDVRVTDPAGRVLLASDFSTGTEGWRMLGGGAWSVQDGALRQAATDREFVRALAGDRSWTDYTLELKARKIAGREGFLVLFHNGEDEDRTWWNLGGWENERHGVEAGRTLDPRSGRIETGRWYALKVEVRGQAVKCWLDGRLVHEVEIPRRSVPGLLASATREDPSGDFILKVVNTAPVPTEAEVHLSGAERLAPTARRVVLTSGSPRDENTLDEPTKVVPRTETMAIPGARWTQVFPANSFTVLRISSEPPR